MDDIAHDDDNQHGDDGDQHGDDDDKVRSRPV